jgi:SAM-dependent methyltransferase
MRVDLAKIEAFYNSPLGEYVQHYVTPIIKRMILKDGFTPQSCIASAASFPYLSEIKHIKTLSLQAYDEHPSWPEQGKEYYVITKRTHWPSRAEETDLVMLMHDVEFAQDPEIYLREAWRVLKGEGQLILMLPNRAGRWAREGNTPFGLGFPYTLEQIEKLLSSAHFKINNVEHALFSRPYYPQLPVHQFMKVIIEKAGLYCLIQPGVYIISAKKEVFIPISSGLATKAANTAKQALFPSKPKVSSHNKDTI